MSKIYYGLIYKTTNLINNKIYTGKTRKIKNHFDGKYKGSGILITKAFKKYGFENFKCQFICYAYSKHELDALEKNYIAKFNSLVPNGYNLTNGGEGGDVYKYMSKDKLDAIKLKMSKSGKNRIVLESTRLKLSKALKGRIISLKQREFLKNTIVVKDKDNNFFRIKKDDHRYLSGELIFSAKNNKHTDETKQKISKIHKGKTISLQHRQQLSLYFKGRKHSEEAKQKMSLYKKGKPGRKHSEEAKQKISNSMKGKIKSKIHLENLQLARMKNK